MNPEAVNFYGEMTNYELGELSMSMLSNVNQSLSIYVSVLFAYLAVAYLAGSKLSQFQLYAISGIYSIFMISQIASLYIQVTSQQELVSYMTEMDNSVIVYSSLFLWVVSWVVSLVFMNQSRSDT